MIALIPARGGSKGLPGKNTKNLNGKPLIAYTIEAALNSKFIKKVIISTDDSDIANIGKYYGADVPFIRPEHLAQDDSKAIDTYIYTVERLNEEFNENIEDFVVLLPTSPLRNEHDIDNAIEEYVDKKALTLISVVESEHPPTWYKKILDNGYLVDYFLESDNSLNRQEVEQSYLPNGAIYIFNFKSLKENMSYYNYKTIPYKMKREKSIDIDTISDFKLAEILLRVIDKEME